MHGGLAFLEANAWQVAGFPTVVINLEGTSIFLGHSPWRFAEVPWTFLSFGAGPRIIRRGNPAVS